MDAIVKATIVYLVLLILFRISGKRSMAEVSPFDLVLLLIISEATQQALIDGDDSMTNAYLLVTTLVGLNILLSEIKIRFKRADRTLESMPLLIVENGKPIDQHLRKERIDVEDVLEAAREMHGIGKLEEIRYAVLERNGKISIIPVES
jgi:uncharacterized membrane protein YcaP (DUF421 family)